MHAHWSSPAPCRSGLPGARMGKPNAHMWRLRVRIRLPQSSAEQVCLVLGFGGLGVTLWWRVMCQRGDAGGGIPLQCITPSNASPSAATPLSWYPWGDLQIISIFIHKERGNASILLGSQNTLWKQGSWARVYAPLLYHNTFISGGKLKLRVLVRHLAAVRKIICLVIH